MRRYGVIMRYDVSADEIASRGVLGRRIPADQVRRVHLYVDANGDEGIVVRSALWRFVHVSRRDLADPALRDRVMSLVDHVRSRAQVDADVDQFLAVAA